MNNEPNVNPVLPAKKWWELPFVTFVQRTWPLLLLFVFTDWLCMTEHHFVFIGKWIWDSQQGGMWIPQTPMEFAGPLLWALPFGLSMILLAILVVHMHFRQTLDAYIQSGQFVREFYEASPEFRMRFFKDVLIGFTIAIAILLAGLARA